MDNDKKRFKYIQGIEMEFLRSMFGKTRRDRIREILKLDKIQEEIEDTKIRWYGIHRCGASGSMRTCHAAGPGSMPSLDKFPG